MYFPHYYEIIYVIACLFMALCLDSDPIAMPRLARTAITPFDILQNMVNPFGWLISFAYTFFYTKYFYTKYELTQENTSKHALILIVILVTLLIIDILLTSTLFDCIFFSVMYLHVLYSVFYVSLLLCNCLFVNVVLDTALEIVYHVLSLRHWFGHAVARKRTWTLNNGWIYEYNDL